MPDFKASTRPEGIYPDHEVRPTATPGDLTIPGTGRADDTESGDFKAPPFRSMPGRRSGLTVWGAGEVTKDGSAYGPSKPAPMTPNTGPLTFERDGQRVLTKDVQRSDVVDLGGRIGKTSVGAAMHVGWLVEGPNGFERAGEAAAGTPAQQQRSEQPQQQQQPQQPAEYFTPEQIERARQYLRDNPDEPVDYAKLLGVAEGREYLHHTEEASLRDFEQSIGTQTFANLEAAMVSSLTEGNKLSENLVEQVAVSLKTDREGALQAIADRLQPLRAQAVHTVAEIFGDNYEVAEEVLSWAQANTKTDFAKALRQQLNNRDLDGYRELSRMWLIDAARKDPKRIAEGIRAAGHKVKVDGGRVLVDMGHGMGWSDLAGAIRGGVYVLGGRR
jgi:hypothetical protein